MTARFGSPVNIEQTDNPSYQKFDFKREGYILTAVCDKNGTVASLRAMGGNKSVAYKGVRLMDPFSKIVLSNGPPKYYVFGDKETTIGYEEFEYGTTSLDSTPRVISILVKYEKEALFQ